LNEGFNTKSTQYGGTQKIVLEVDFEELRNSSNPFIILSKLNLLIISISFSISTKHFLF
jgi:hypothetical protein